MMVKTAKYNLSCNKTDCFIALKFYRFKMFDSSDELMQGNRLMKQKSVESSVCETTAQKLQQ